MLTFLHPFHVSVVEVRHNPEQKSLQVTTRIFLDDFEQTLRSRSGESVDIMKAGSEEKLDLMIEQYILENFELTVDGKEKGATYLGHEIEGDVLWCYIEYPKVKKLESIQIVNELLTEIFDDQENIVHLYYQDEVRSLRLKGRKLSGEVDWL